KLQCIELLIVRGWSNKAVAESLGLTEQQVANYKFDFISRTRTLMTRKGLSEDVFPELYADS
ncbi:MAG: RNA polymerase subunit sigma-70, partial [Planctomycetota bacterium]|nr:RNA polymerase subunit sigma-70 [Planctomycetota bacterium]